MLLFTLRRPHYFSQYQQNKKLPFLCLHLDNPRTSGDSALLLSMSEANSVEISACVCRCASLPSAFVRTGRRRSPYEESKHVLYIYFPIVSILHHPASTMLKINNTKRTDHPHSVRSPGGQRYRGCLNTFASFFQGEAPQPSVARVHPSPIMIPITPSPRTPLQYTRSPWPLILSFPHLIPCSHLSSASFHNGSGVDPYSLSIILMLPRDHREAPMNPPAFTTDPGRIERLQRNYDDSASREQIPRDRREKIDTELLVGDASRL